MKVVNLNFAGETGGITRSGIFKAQKRCCVCHRFFESRFMTERLCPSCKKPGGEMNAFVSHVYPPPQPSQEKFFLNTLAA